MVIDAFHFYNELDLLEIRLNILDKYVDYFVLVEGDETFMGVPKTSCFHENRERFAKWNHKIIHYIVDDFPFDNKIYEKALASPNTGNHEHWWVNEFYQKESMIKALKQFKNSDIIYVSDVDEIWNPKMKLDFSKKVTYRPKQTAYHYFLNNRSDQEIGGWTGTRCAKLGTIRKYGINHFRTERENPSVLVEDGGWHFTFMGGKDAIEEKIKAYGHQEYNNQGIFDNIETSMSSNRDFLNRGFNLWKDESDLPEYILNNKGQWKHLLL
jgi:beta-1,4-mannosyl-glycoprotein beta-1,4-N-acetylglucosaminyltransferase